ncbi:MAG TPA: 50S ribosomal protein L21 [Terriglobales bacterium]|nr:50S ribosomal protein L21 [Terriglobales bacterium]
MYAVIRAGGKQYRVAPGDVIKIEKSASTKPDAHGKFQFDAADVLAFSSEPGNISTKLDGGATVTGQVVEEGRAKKILVFHFKRKKQYKKLQGHRQGFTAVRISEISFEGKKATAPELAASKGKAKKAKAAGESKAPAKKANKGGTRQAPGKKQVVKKKVARKATKKK